MTTRPRLNLGNHLLSGIAAVALFALLAAVFLTSTFPEPQGFPADAHITAAIGFAMFDIPAGDVPAEGFIASFFIIAIVLDAALDGAVMLARRDEDHRPEAVSREVETVTTGAVDLEDSTVEPTTGGTDRNPSGGGD
ncbi:proton-conducting membrane transporter [Natronorarus salvus]|uniref:proton-conducting membrane transporter n=1 Tax=Natronorarus salvus TaxID=3117733 RepID=UPI002F26398C